jgi:hypothetical protein
MFGALERRVGDVQTAEARAEKAKARIATSKTKLVALDEAGN